jgi:hypothetical protein
MQLKAFALRIVEAPELDEDGEPVTTMVVDWNVTAADGAYTQSERLDVKISAQAYCG